MRKLQMPELGRMEPDEFKESPKAKVCLILDNIRSLHNVGSIFRSADAFRLAHLYLGGYTGCPPNPEIRKTALGATDSVEWTHIPDLLEFLPTLSTQGWKIIALEQTDQSIALPLFIPDPSISYAFVLGNEVEGVRDQVLAYCHGAIEIPQWGTKHSLNVAVAAGILLYQVNSGVWKS
jgi:tRNA G18 (ribose-2'-O)-methylase SpoU